MIPFIVGAVVAVILLAIIVANLQIVPQARGYVMERLGVYSATWHTGLHIRIPFIEKVAKKVNHYFVMGSQYDSPEAIELVNLVRDNDTHFIGVLAGHIHASVEYNITDKLKQYTTSSALIGYGREIIIK